MKNLKTILLIAAFPIIGNSAILGAWDVDGVDVADGIGVNDTEFPYTLNANSSVAHVVGGALTLGFDSPSGAVGLFGFKFSSGTHQSSITNAIAMDNHIQFSLTAESGYSLNLSSLELNGESGTSGPDNIALMSDATGFLAGQEIGSLNNRQNITGGWDTDASGWGGPIDLAGADFQGLESITFRIYGWNSSGTASAGIRNLSGNDLVINGTVQAIPEPAVIGFITLAALGGLVGKRLFT